MFPRSSVLDIFRHSAKRTASVELFSFIITPSSSSSSFPIVLSTFSWMSMPDSNGDRRHSYPIPPSSNPSSPLPGHAVLSFTLILSQEQGGRFMGAVFRMTQPSQQIHRPSDVLFINSDCFLRLLDPLIIQAPYVIVPTICTALVHVDPTWSSG